MWLTRPTVDSAIKQLTKITDQLAVIADDKYAEYTSLTEACNRANFELERAQRIHQKLTNLLD